MSARVLCGPDEVCIDVTNRRDGLRRHVGEHNSSSVESEHCLRSIFRLFARRKPGSKRQQKGDLKAGATSKPTGKQERRQEATYMKAHPATAPHPANRMHKSLQDPNQLKASQVPQMWYYSSNHILINQERARCDLSPLRRSSGLDEAARKKAEVMATSRRKNLPSDKSRLTDRFNVTQCDAENVARGESIRHVHSKLMQSHKDRANILNPRFTSMGIGTAKDSSGKLYVCQFFAR